MKTIETFWCSDVTVIQILAHFEFKTYKDFKTISILFVLNCFKYFLIYFLRQNVSKKLNKKNFQKNKSLCAKLS